MSSSGSRGALWQRASPQRLLDATDAVLCRRHFLDFVRLAWPLVEPADPLVENWHIGAICEHLEAVARGQIQRLLINVPPGHAKSKLVGVLWPAWMWTWRPSWRAIFGSYSEALALRDAVDARRLVESEWYRRLFSGPSEWSLTDDQNQKHLYANTASGSRQATGVGGGGTGFRCNARITDDPISALEALSKPRRDEVTEWWDKTMSGRLNDLRTDSSVVIMQRLHEDDLSGHLLRKGGYEHLCLPSEFDPDHRAVTYHVRSRSQIRSLEGGTEPTTERVEFWRDPRTEDGELLFPQRFPRAVIEQAKLDLADAYPGQHQQRPTLAGGGMFKIADWRFWKPDGEAPDYPAGRPRGCYQGPARPLPKLDRLIISVDATFKKTTDGSFVAIHVWGTGGADRILLDRVHERMDFDETVRALLSVIKRWPKAREKIIEDKANGSAIISTLTNRHKISGCVAENPGTENKEQRAAAYLPYHRAGNVYLPDGAPWLEEYIGEHAAFPRGRTSDDVDAQSQALKHLEEPETLADRWARLQR